MNTQEREEQLKQLALAWKTYDEHFSNCARLEEAFTENKDKRTFWYIQEEEKMDTASKNLSEVIGILIDVEDKYENAFWVTLQMQMKDEADTINEIFDINVDAVPISDIRKVFMDNNCILDVADYFEPVDQWESFKSVIKNIYKNLLKKKYKFTERPFFNDNFEILRILKESQIEIAGEYLIPLSQKDVSNISGFNLNKVQEIMSMFIKWDYLERTKGGKYKLTETGNAMLNSLMKIPCTKIVE